MSRVLVIGAGPMGIAAAVGAADRGADVTVLERGEVGASLRTWGPTRFFSPLHMNLSARMRGETFMCSGEKNRVGPHMRNDAPTSPRSSTITSAPRSAAPIAAAIPIGPAPITSTRI